jgi:hypothetical protein
MTKKQIEYFIRMDKPIKDFKEMHKMLEEMSKKTELKREFENKRKEKNS